MIDLINSWAQGLIVSVIIAVIIEMVLPDGNNKKYVKVVLGMYIMFSIVYPIVNFVSKGNINLNSIITSANKEINMNTIDIETNKYIESTYKNNLKENITNELTKKGYKVLNLNLYVETEDNKRYGQINSLVMNIEKINEELKQTENVNNVEEIKIDISNNKTEIKDEEIPKNEIDNLKGYLENSYSIEIQKIHINE
ncbi:MAG: stage III sporulation protein AF [Clostridia bacterium]|nr:stage III sporulation protein AF [Clostridia bacterium]